MNTILYLTSSLLPPRAAALSSCQLRPRSSIYRYVSSCSLIRQEPPINRTSFCYQRIDCDSFRDFLREVTWNYIPNHSVEKCAIVFSFWVKNGIEVFVPAEKYQLKPQSSWFSPAYSACISHRNHFWLYQGDRSNFNRRRFAAARNGYKCVLEEAKSLFAYRIRDSIAHHKFGSRDYRWLCKSVMNKSKSSVPSLSIQLADKSEGFARKYSPNSTHLNFPPNQSLY